MAIPTTGDEGICEGMGLKCKNHDKDLGTQTTIHNNVLTLFRMKKTRVLGVALTLAATMAVGGAMGQMPTNFVEIKSGSISDANVVSLVEMGKTYGFIAKPDAAFHSSFDTDGKLTNGFTWSWTATTFPTGAVATIVKTAGGLADGSKNWANHATINVDKTGKYIIDVKETASSAWGGCSSVARQFTIHAFAAPSLEATTVSSSDALCVTASSDVLKNSHFKFYSSGSPYVKYKITVENGTVGAGGVTWEAATDFVASNVVKPTPAWDWNRVADASVKADLAADGTQISQTAALDTTTHSLATYDFEIAKKLTAPDGVTYKVKKYTVIVEGMNGLLTRKSEYDQAAGTAPGAGFAGYPLNITSGKSNKVSYIFAVAPKTGPVYHIGNNVAN